MVRRIRNNHFLLPLNAPFKKEQVRPSQSALAGCQLPQRGSQGSLYEFALVHFDWCSAYRRKPLRRYAPSSYCVLSSCTPPYGRLHLLNLSGEVYIYGFVSRSQARSVEEPWPGQTR